MDLANRLIDDIKKASKVSSYCKAIPPSKCPVATYFTVELPHLITEVFQAFSFFEGSERMKTLYGTDLHTLYFYLDPLRKELSIEINRFLSGDKTFLNLLSGNLSKILLEETLNDLHEGVEKNYSLFESMYIDHCHANDSACSNTRFQGDE
jgi:hypothetical protein